MKRRVRATRSAIEEGKESGYVLFGIAVGLVILGIFMVAAVPLWQKVVQREREKELIFRGYQYMQAIELYQRKYPGAFPPNLDALVDEKFLRQIYKDPMSEGGEGEFKILRQMSPELQLGSEQQQREAAAAAGITDTNRSRARLRTPGGSPAGGARGSTRSPTGGRFQSSLGRTALGSGSDTGMGGIVGVVSSSDEKTFYQVPGKETYKDWLFVYGVQQMGPGGFGGVGGAGAGGVGAGSVGAGSPGANPQALAAMAGAFRGAATGAGGIGNPNLNPSPFPGLPPPPGLTSFRFGSTPMGQQGQPGQVPGLTNAPGAQPGQSRQPGVGPGTGAGNPFAPRSFQQPGMQGQPQSPFSQQQRSRSRSRER
jgi:type II secretory pathway pseudopilin PulG